MKGSEFRPAEVVDKRKEEKLARHRKARSAKHSKWSKETVQQLVAILARHVDQACRSLCFLNALFGRPFYPSKQAISLCAGQIPNEAV